MSNVSPLCRVLSEFGFSLDYAEHVLQEYSRLDEIMTQRLHEQIDQGLKRLDPVAKAMEGLIAVVSGLNLQDQPLSVQREVRDALSKSMRALRGERADL